MSALLNGGFYDSDDDLLNGLPPQGEEASLLLDSDDENGDATENNIRNAKHIPSDVPLVEVQTTDSEQEKPSRISDDSNTKSSSTHKSLEDGEDDDEDGGIDSLLSNTFDNIFILTEAGKPVFSRSCNERRLVTLAGLMQALPAYVRSLKTQKSDSDDDGGLDKIICIRAGGRIFSFVTPPNLIIVGLAKSPPVSQLQLNDKLMHMYYQISSRMPLKTLNDTLSRQPNFDLRRCLSSELHLFHRLWDELTERPFSYLLSAVPVLTIPNTLRASLSSILSSVCKSSCLFYALVMTSDARLVTVSRWKQEKRKLFPVDFTILMNTVLGTVGSSQHNFQVCLPKFRCQGFVNAAVYRLDEPLDSLYLVLLSTLQDANQEPLDLEKVHQVATDFKTKACSKSTFSFVDLLSRACESSLKQQHLLSTPNGSGGYLLLGSYSIYRDIKGICSMHLKHFVYKPRAYDQYTQPIFEAPYTDPDAKQRLMSVYQEAHSCLHGLNLVLKGTPPNVQMDADIISSQLASTNLTGDQVNDSNGDEPIRQNLVTISTPHETCFAWLRSKFELYAIFSPLTGNADIESCISDLINWIRENENRVFMSKISSFS